MEEKYNNLKRNWMLYATFGSLHNKNISIISDFLFICVYLSSITWYEYNRRKYYEKLSIVYLFEEK